MIYCNLLCHFNELFCWKTYFTTYLIPITNVCEYEHWTIIQQFAIYIDDLMRFRMIQTENLGLNEIRIDRQSSERRIIECLTKSGGDVKHVY